MVEHSLPTLVPVPLPICLQQVRWHVRSVEKLHVTVASFRDGPIAFPAIHLESLEAFDLVLAELLDFAMLFHPGLEAVSLTLLKGFEAFSLILLGGVNELVDASLHDLDFLVQKLLVVIDAFGQG